MSCSFIHLNVHTEYSLFDGLLRIDSLVKNVADNNMPAIAVTESGNLFSVIKFYRAAERVGIKPVVGAEIRLVDSEPASGCSRLTLLCQNPEGYRNLVILLTRSYTNGQYQGKAYICREWLNEYSSGLIVLSGGKEGDVGQAILASNKQNACELLDFWCTKFPDRYYLELQRTGRHGEDQYIRGAVDLALRYNLPVVATNDVRFMAPEDYEAHEARVCIQQGFILNDPRRPRNYSQQQYLRTTAEMVELFSDLPEAIENSCEIAKRCTLEIDLGQNFLPHFPVPDNSSQEQWLRQKAMEGLEFRKSAGHIDKYGITEYQARLESELDVINSMGFPGYFLIVADFIQWAKDQGIPVGPGRGSGAGSLVAYALGITELDPLKYDLLFERFLNPERVSLPDFDVDFCMDRRDEVIDYVAQRFGRDHVSQIITHGTMAAKAVVRDVGRVLGYPYGFVDQIAKLIPFELNITLQKALDDEEILRQRYQDEENVNTLINLAMKLEGLTRNAGRHAGGIVIAPKPLTEYMPLYCEQGSTVTVTQFDMGDAEAVGLVKFDFLGLRTLTIINNAVMDINRLSVDVEKNRNEIHIDTIPLDDEETFSLIRRTDTTAIFQLESDGMKKLIKRLQPDSFDDLIALVALFRPGPLQSGMVDDFIERKHGRSAIKYLHPALEHILKPTYGVILYQEQVMQIAQVLAGYTLGAADLLRRAMGKKKPEEMAKQREIFINGAMENNVSTETANIIFDLMEKFAGYGFNKSHSAAYALIAYQTAWLKTHYPAAFMAAVLSADMDNTDKVVTLLDELQRMNIKIESPDVNNSYFMFTVSDKNNIRYGLGAIKGIGRSAVENIIKIRQESGKYSDLFDFCKRVDLHKINKRVLEALIKSGAMDNLGPGRSSLFASLGTALQFAEQHNRNTMTGQDDLFGLTEVVPSDEKITDFIRIPDWSDEERLTGEKETLGFYLKGHPIIRYENEINLFITCKLKNIVPGNVILAGYIHRIRTRTGNRGKMAEIILDDRTARVNLTVYSDKYQQFRNLLIKDTLIIVKGEVVADDYYDSGFSVIAREIFDIEQARNRFAALNICLTAAQSNETTLEWIKNILTANCNGNSKINVTYQNGDAICHLELGNNWRINVSDNLLVSLKNTLGNDNVSLQYNM